MTEELRIPNPLPEGYAVESVRILAVKERYEQQGEAFLAQTFTAEERAEAGEDPDWEYLAGRLAVKQAFLKLLFPNSMAENKNFGWIMTLRCPDGAPRVTVLEPLRSHMERSGISRLLVSVTNEDGYALALCYAG